VAERVWQELARGLMEATPSRMFDVLRECGALKVLLPEVDRLWGVPQRADYHPEVDTGVHLMMVLDMARACGRRCRCALPAWCTTWARAPRRRHAAAPHRPRGAQRQTAQGRVRAPARAGGLPRNWPTWWRASTATSTAAATSAQPALVRLLERCDAIRKPERFGDILLACECDARGRLGDRHRPR
jgi:tRNA nucleotidyltransferase (CCA-adding enzyme)